MASGFDLLDRIAATLDPGERNCVMPPRTGPAGPIPLRATGFRRRGLEFAT